MTRLTALAFVALGAAGCLDPGEPYLGRLDETPPTILQTNPSGEPGILWARAAPMEVVFSEAMEPRSLRPGISLVQGNVEQSLIITLDIDGEPPVTPADPDIAFPVRIEQASGPLLPNTNYTLLFRTLLIDKQGNPLPEEKTVNFRTGG